MFVTPKSPHDLPAGCDLLAPCDPCRTVVPPRSPLRDSEASPAGLEFLLPWYQFIVVVAMTAKKSLSERLADLTSAAPSETFNPDAPDFDDGTGAGMAQHTPVGLGWVVAKLH